MILRAVRKQSLCPKSKDFLDRINGIYGIFCHRAAVLDFGDFLRRRALRGKIQKYKQWFYKGLQKKRLTLYFFSSNLLDLCSLPTQW